MEKSRDKQMEEQIDRWKKIDRQIDRQMEKKTRQIDRQTDKQIKQLNHTCFCRNKNVDEKKKGKLIGSPAFCCFSLKHMQEGN